MLLRNKLFKRVFHTQTEFDEHDKQQIERIIFYLPTEDQMIQFNEISKNIKSLHLKSINLYDKFDIASYCNLQQLYWDSGHTNQIPKQLFSSICHLQSLYELSFTMRQGISLYYGFFKELFQDNLQKLPHFSKLVMRFEMDIFDSNNVEDMINNIRFLQNLKHLRVSNRSLQKSQISLIKRTWESFCSLPNLESLDVDLHFEKAQDTYEVDFYEVVKGKPICNKLKNLRLLLIDSNLEDYLINLLQALTEFKNLEILVFQAEMYGIHQEIDRKFNQILQNNKNSLKKLDLLLFFSELINSDQAINDGEAKSQFTFFETLGQLYYLEEFTLLTNLFKGFKPLEGMTSSLKNCMHLNKLVLYLDLKVFDYHNLDHIKQFFNNILQLPYLTNCITNDESQVSEKTLDIHKTKIDIFDVESQITHYLDPFTISKIYTKFQKQLKSNQFTIHKVYQLFLTNYKNGTLYNQDFAKCYRQKKNKEGQQLSEENELCDHNEDQSIEHRVNSSSDESDISSLWDSINQDEYSQDNSSIEIDYFYEFNYEIANYISEKELEILKIFAYQQEILVELKKEIGDVQFINHSYWDLYI